MSTIESVAELTGVDLSAALTRVRSLDAGYRLATSAKASINEAKTLARGLPRVPEGDVPAKWAEIREKALDALVWAHLGETVADAYDRPQERAQSDAPWKALALLSEHIQKRVTELAKLPLNLIRTPQDAINNNKGDAYKTAERIFTELEQIAELPQIDYDETHTWVLVDPPELPEIATDDQGRPVLPDDPNSKELTTQAKAIVQAGKTSTREALKTAATLGWTITPATNHDTYTQRRRRIRNAVSYTRGALRIFLDTTT